MNNSLESFISYCDNMMIAEESYKDLLSKKKLIEIKVKALRIDLANDKIPYEKKCKMIDETVTELEQLKNEFSKIKATDLERNMDQISAIIKTTVGILVIIPEALLGKKGIGDHMLTDSLTRVCQTNNVEKFRKDAIDNITLAINDFKKIKPYLKNTDTANEGFVQRLKDKHEANKILKSHGYTGLNKYDKFEKDSSEAKSKIDKIKNNGTKSDFLKKHKDAYEFMKKLASITKTNTERIIKKYKKVPKVNIDDYKTYFLVYFEYGEDFNDFDYANDMYEEIENRAFPDNSNNANELNKYKIYHELYWRDRCIVIGTNLK